MKKIKYRLTHDFQLAIVTLMGTIVLVGITPFMILRAMSGQWWGFAIDLLIQAGILGSMLRAWVSGDTHGTSLFLAYFIGITASLAVYILGAPGKYWFYPAIVANFFLVDRRHALGIALISLLVVLAGGAVTETPADAASFVVTVVVCALLSYTFAYRTETQRTQLETLATKDALTGVFNRHTLLEEVERAHRTFQREQRQYGLLILDLDLFKSINDCYGHQAGDQVLIDFTRLLEQQIRKDDRLFRYGGEEFVILVQGVSSFTLNTMAENLRGSVERCIRKPDQGPVTVSIGGSVLRTNETVEHWFARADAYLYQAKNAGRNRVIIDADA